MARKQKAMFPCPYCGHLNPVGDRYCDKCDKRMDQQTAPAAVPSAGSVEDTKACPACGNINSADMLYCAKCGADTTKEYIQCPLCQQMTPREEKNCDHCGKSIAKGRRTQRTVKKWYNVVIGVLVVCALVYGAMQAALVLGLFTIGTATLSAFVSTSNDHVSITDWAEYWVENPITSGKVNRANISVINRYYSEMPKSADSYITGKRLRVYGYVRSSQPTYSDTHDQDGWIVMVSQEKDTMLMACVFTGQYYKDNLAKLSKLTVGERAWIVGDSLGLQGSGDAQAVALYKCNIEG